MEEKTEAPGLHKLNGVNWPWMVTQEALDTLKHYDVWDDDVWVTTYPKSGSHWVLEIVNLIHVNGVQEKINRDQQSVPVEFDLSQSGRTLPAGLRKPPVAQFKAMKQWQSPRALMTHVTEELMPDKLYQGKGKVIYVIRNPKDANVSFWYFAQQWNFDSRYVDWDYFFKAYLSEDMMFGLWFTHVLNFWKKHRYDKNVLFVKYEDMKQDIKGAVIQIADFLGKNLSEEVINLVVEYSSLKSMKTRFQTAKSSSTSEAKGTTAESSPSGDGQSAPPSDKKTFGAPLIIRKGTVGDWKTMFTVAQNEAFDEIYKNRMAGSGLALQFE